MKNNTILYRDITGKQKEIIQWVYNFHFLHRIHIQTLMDHKTHNRINEWLSDLISKDYLAKIDNTNVKSNNNPYIYYLTKKGLRFIRSTGINNQYLDRLLNAEKQSFITKDHNLLTADIYLLLRSKVNSFQTQAELANEKAISIILPDAFYTYQLPDKTRSYFLEVDRETETSAAMKRKFARYFQYYLSHEWKKISSTFFPAICVISLTDNRTDQLRAIAEQLLQEFNYTPVIFKFTTFEALNEDIEKMICKVSFKQGSKYFLL